MILALITPFIFLIALSVSLGSIYSETYYAALLKQYDRLNSVEGERVVLIGNSNVSFGADSELFQELYGKPLVSFGLYGSLGTKLMLDLSKSGIKRGDTVVLALEFNEDAYSLDFHSETVLKALETRPSLLFRTDFDNYEDILGGVFGFVATKFSFAAEGVAPTNEGVYKNSSINSYGEIEKGLRPGNILREGCLAEIVMTDPEDIEDGFIDYLNEYIDYCKIRGITVLYSFSPVNGKAVEEQGVSKDDLYDFYDYLCEALHCPVISDPNVYTLDYRYFYDTNFHLNDAGAVVRTINLVRDLKLFDGDNLPITAEFPAPPEPVVPVVEIDKTLDYTDSELFEYKESAEGYLTIIGTKDGAETLTDIIVPVIHDGKYVIKIGSYALENLTEARSITIPVGISELSSFAFAGCNHLSEIILLEDSGNDLSVYYDTFSGINQSCKIVLRNAEKASFLTGYFWPQVKLEIVEG